MSKISTFAARCMQLISGQMPLPQSTFRHFLDELNDDLDSVSTSAGEKLPADAITVSDGKLVFTIGDNTYTVTPDTPAASDAEE